jgi:hypothetical protein
MEGTRRGGRTRWRVSRVDLQRRFQVFAVDAFRIETRDSYDVAAEAPAIAEFEATGRIIIY